MASDFECNLCGSRNGKSIPFRYAFKDRFLWGMKCTSCGLVSIWPRPSDEEIKEMYGEQYYTEADSKTHHMEVDYLQILNAGDHGEGVAKMKKICPPGSHILEIGCATGNYLAALKQEGYHVKGIELSDFAVEYAHRHFGISIINKPFGWELLNNGVSENEFDVVVMGDVLEHFTDPTQAMLMVNKILKPGGVALIQVPGTLNLLSSRLAFFIFRLTGSQKTMHIPPYHLTEFTESTLRRLLKRTGFSKVKVTQLIKPPSDITLRGSTLENMVKKYMQYINYGVTRIVGLYGDRIHAEAYK